MSSDSEDDCYGNAAQKLQKAMSAFKKDKIDSTNLLIELQKNDCTDLDNGCSKSLHSETEDEISLDTIIANYSKERSTHAAKRSADIDASKILPKRKTRASQREQPRVLGNETNDGAVNTSVEESPVQARGRRRGRGINRRTTSNRGRGRRQTSLQEFISPSRPRGRNRQTRGWRRDWNFEDPALYDLALGLAASTQTMTRSHTNNGPIYSVGNTDDYPDQCDSQQLFSSTTTSQNDVVIVENDELDDDNEKLSVKVDWQNYEIFRFYLRKLEPLTTIFEHFSNKEKVAQDKLLFMYNEKILKSSDTPYSINYNIAKFIDGGIVSQSVTDLIRNKEQRDEEGIKLKFQCQNVKKPYILCIGAEEKLKVVMMKCAQILGKPLESLKFVFDGDVISDKSTPKELELEGGECIDVKYLVNI